MTDFVSAIQDAAIAVAERGGCAADHDHEVLLILANKIPQPDHGLLLVFFGLQKGQVKGFKVLVDAPQYETMLSELMGNMVYTIRRSPESALAAELRKERVYVIPPDELWTLIKKGQSPENYAHLEALAVLSKPDRAQLARAVQQKISER